MFDTRIIRTRETVFKKNLDGFLISNPFNILYLTGFKGLNPQERESWVLITKQKTYLFTDTRHEIPPIFGVQTSKCEIRWLTPEKRLITHLQEIVSEEKLKKIGFEAENVTVAEQQFLSEKLKEARLIAYTKTISKLREVKDKTEIEKIRRACEISDQCLDEIKKTIKVGQSEKEIAFRIEFWLKEQGYESAFDPIVAIDENAAVPHYNTKEGKGKVMEGSAVLIDFGAKYQDYCSDMTRMFFVGTPSDEIRSAYEKLLQAQEETIENTKKLKKTKEVDQFCRSLLTKENLPNIPHSVGHGVGLQVHEAPSVSSRSKDVIVPNQVFTIEPGIYILGKFGIRIEDTVLIDDQNQAETLTNYSKKPTIL